MELEHEKPDGGVLLISMLRPIEWIHQQGIHSGGSFQIDMPELGAKGLAKVLALKPCPEIQAGSGHVVLSTFAHPATHEILDVTIGQGEDAETIGVTETHPFWSVQDEAFVPVGQLVAGSQVLTADEQTKTITSILPRPGPAQQVYNLEVNGEHVYYVGHQQLLVHNEYVELYRVVEPAELDSIARHGNKYVSGGSKTLTPLPGIDGKWFYSSLDEATDAAAVFGKADGIDFTVTKIRISKSALKHHFPKIDATASFPFGKEAFFVEMEDLANSIVEFLP